MIKQLLLTTSSILILAGCAPVALQDIDDKTYHYAKSDLNATYHTMSAKCIDGVLNKLLEASLNKELRDRNIYGDDLQIYCRISSHDPGNRALRYLVGFGAGAAKTIIEADLVNDTNQTIDKVLVNAALYIGGLGGDANQTIHDSANEIVDHFEEHFITERE